MYTNLPDNLPPTTSPTSIPVVPPPFGNGNLPSCYSGNPANPEYISDTDGPVPQYTCDSVKSPSGACPGDRTPQSECDRYECEYTNPNQVRLHCKEAKFSKSNTQPWPTRSTTESRQTKSTQLWTTWSSTRFSTSSRQIACVLRSFETFRQRDTHTSTTTIFRTTWSPFNSTSIRLRQSLSPTSSSTTCGKAPECKWWVGGIKYSHQPQLRCSPWQLTKK